MCKSLPPRGGIKRNGADARVDDQSGDDQAPTATPRVASPDA
jgi:hypothetical protein